MGGSMVTMDGSVVGLDGVDLDRAAWVSTTATVVDAYAQRPECEDHDESEREKTEDQGHRRPDLTSNLAHSHGTNVDHG